MATQRSGLVKHFPDQTRESFRAYVAELVARRGPSVRAIEERAGMPQGALNKFLKGERWISAENLKLLADYFRLPFDELWRRSRGEAPLRAEAPPEAKLAETIGWAVVRAIQGLPEERRRELVGLEGRPSPKPRFGTPEYKRQQAMKMTARLAQMFSELPEDEQEEIWRIVEERRRLREREERAEAQRESQG